MVLLVGKLYRSLNPFSKLENHGHPPSKSSSSASLQAFQWEIFTLLNQFLIDQNPPGSELWSLSWINRCLESVSIVNRAFAKLSVSLDHPAVKWEADTVEEYLDYTLKLLDLVNSITSSVSQLGQARLCLSHALTQFENSPSPVKIDRLSKVQSKEINIESLKTEDAEQSSSSGDGEEQIIRRALVFTRKIGFWACGVVLSGLSGDLRPYLAMKPVVGDAGFGNHGLNRLDSGIRREMEQQNGVVQEVREVNEAVDWVNEAVAKGEDYGDGVKELERRLGVVEKMVDGLKKVGDCLFYEVLGGRNELVNCLRQHKE